VHGPPVAEKRTLSRRRLRWLCAPVRPGTRGRDSVEPALRPNKRRRRTPSPTTSSQRRPEWVHLAATVAPELDRAGVNLPAPRPPRRASIATVGVREVWLTVCGRGRQVMRLYAAALPLPPAKAGWAPRGTGPQRYGAVGRRTLSPKPAFKASPSHLPLRPNLTRVDHRPHGKRIRCPPLLGYFEGTAPGRA